MRPLPDAHMRSISPLLYCGTLERLGVLAKLSNEAVNCRKRDALRQTGHDI
jgi:hypothetical protein